MSQQQDSFYQKLPFTLQQGQLNPEYIILGTGLQQSIIAAYLSKMQEKRGLILDLQKTYGSCLKTVSLKQLHQFSNGLQKQRLYEFFVPEQYQNKNQQFFNQTIDKKAWRGYNVDIQPSFFFANSITCQCLKQADMDKYMDFRLVNRMIKYQKGKFQDVPLSKGKIFETKQLSLMQKKTLLTSLHTLIKIFHRHMKIQQDQNSTKQFDKGFGQVSGQVYNQFQSGLHNHFLPFLQKLTKKNKKIIDYLVYIICNYQYSYDKPIPQHMKEAYQLGSFVEKFGKFIMSCGIYGEGPYLYVDNGVGDIPQAFSRIASIFGSAYILHPKLQINSIQQNQHQIIVKSNLAPGKQIKTKKIFYGSTFSQFYQQNCPNHKQVDIYSEKVLRVLILTKKLGVEEECPALGYFLNLNQFQHPVYLFMFDDASHSCPSGFFLYQFETIVTCSEKQSIQLKTKALIEILTQIRSNSFQQSIVYQTNYIRTRNFNVKKKIQSQERKQVPLQDTYGLDLDIHFENFIDIFGQKDNYFKKKNPYQQEDQDQYGFQTNNILEQLQNINIHEITQNDKINSNNNNAQTQTIVQSYKVLQIQKIVQNDQTINLNQIKKISNQKVNLQDENLIKTSKSYGQKIQQKQSIIQINQIKQFL